MNVRLDESFTVAAPRSDVWDLLSDPQKVVSCVPGASITEKIGDNKYRGAVSMKVGPVRASFRGDITIEEMDEEAGELTLTGVGKNARGRDRASMQLHGKIRALDDNNTEVITSMELGISGKLAQFGSRLIVDISRRVFAKFVAEFQAKVTMPH